MAKRIRNDRNFLHCANPSGDHRNKCRRSNLQKSSHGKKVAGAVAGVVIPPTVIMMLFAGVIASIKDYPPVEAAFTGVGAGSAAIILVVLAQISKNTFKNIRDVLTAVGALVLLRVLRISSSIIFKSASARQEAEKKYYIKYEALM